MPSFSANGEDALKKQWFPPKCCY